MTVLSAVIKKELKQAFPGIKFSVTTKRDDVRVEWVMTLGTAATKQAVKEICKRHETVEHHGNLMDDTAWSSGISIYCYPICTQERKDWAVAGVVDYKFADATWDAKYERFMRANGEEHYHATKLYYSYRDNGVASQFIDENGWEPSEKRWYYERLNPLVPQPEPQPEQVEPEIEAPIAPLIVAITQPETAVNDEPCYYYHSDEYAYASIRDASYRCYVCNPETESKQTQPEVEPELLAIDCRITTDKYRIKITDVRTETVTGQLLDDNGNLILEYGHPVYVCARKSEILSSSEQPQSEPETISPAAPETNLIPFPSLKQPEPQPVAQPQDEGENDFYLQSYQKWVDKLIARGEYGKIKSFDGWYAIAIEVM